MKSPDAILLAYVEARERLASAPGLALALHSGLVTALLCETKRCIGSPRRDKEGVWACSICRKPWSLEQVELGRTQIGGRVSMWGGSRQLVRTRTPARSPESRAHRVLLTYGGALEQLSLEQPHAFCAWRLHVLDDAEVQAGRANCLGLPLELIPPRMVGLLAEGALPRCDAAVTVYRVRKWISAARRRAVEILEERVRRTVAASAALRSAGGK